MSVGAPSFRVPIRQVIQPVVRWHLSHRPFSTQNTCRAADSAANAVQRETPSSESSSPEYPPPSNSPNSNRESRDRLLSSISKRQPSNQLYRDLIHSRIRNKAQSDAGVSLNRPTPTAVRQQGMIKQGMNLPQKQGGSSKYTEHVTGTLPPLAAPLRLDAFVGRSEPVGPQGLAAAIRRMDIKCAINKVRSDSAQQKFHERPGLKRKRLKSERHRKRFKDAFRATVRKVQRMRSQGW